MLQERVSLNDVDGCRISSQGDSPASLIVLQGNVKRLLMSVIYGESSQGSFAILGPDGYWLKTSQGSVQAKMDGSLEEYCETWPKWGIMSDGVAGELQISVPLTGGKGSSSWRTPCSSEAEGGVMEIRPGANAHYKLRDQVATMWPTPTTQEAEHPKTELTTTGRRLTKDGNNSHSIGLADKVLWPTPTCRDVKGQNSEAHLAKERGHHDQLPNALVISGQRGSLNPDWVECLMGLPVGWTDVDGPPGGGHPQTHKNPSI